MSKVLKAFLQSSESMATVASHSSVELQRAVMAANERERELKLLKARWANNKALKHSTKSGCVPLTKAASSAASTVARLRRGHAASLHAVTRPRHCSSLT